MGQFSVEISALPGSILNGNQQPLDSFWTKRGYRKLDGLVTEFAWPVAPGGPNLMHPMSYWMREL